MNEHHILGHRPMSVADVAMVNEIKIHEALTLELVRKVQAHIAAEIKDAEAHGDTHEVSRLRNAEPPRWCAIARSDLQAGFMALVRAIGQPVTP